MNKLFIVEDNKLVDINTFIIADKLHEEHISYCESDVVCDECHHETEYKYIRLDPDLDVAIEAYICCDKCNKVIEIII